MTARHRLIILLIFAGIFIAVAPALILFTVGYRYNWQKNKIEQVGVLIADTLPKNALLRLNNETLPKTRPLRLPSLKPNYYSLRAEREGYFSWQKNIEIKSRETALFYDIALFKRSTPILLQEGAMEPARLSPKENRLAYFQDNALWVYDLEDGGRQMIYRSTFLSPSERKISWAPDNRLILLEEKKGGVEHSVAIDSEKKENVTNLGSFAPSSLTNLAWDDNDRLYGLSGGALYIINIKTRSFEKLAQGVSAYAALDEDVFIAKNTARETIVYQYESLNIFDDGLTRLASLPLAHYQILAYKNNFLAVGNPADNIIYLIDASDDNQPILRLDGQYAVWGAGAKNNYLYFYDDAELWLFDPKIRRTALLFRHSGGIKNVIPLPNLPYFLIQVGDSLQMAELDDRDTRQTNELYNGRGLNNVILDKKSTLVYFIDKLKNGNGLSRLDIQ